MSRSPYSQYLNVNAPVWSDFFFIFQAKVGDISSWNFTIWYVNVFFRDIDVIKQIKLHIVIVRLWISFGDREILIQVESHNILKTQSLFFVHSYQLFIDSKRSAPCSQSKNACLSLSIFSLNFFFDDGGSSERCFSWSWKKSRGNFLN